MGFVLDNKLLIVAGPRSTEAAGLILFDHHVPRHEPLVSSTFYSAAFGQLQTQRATSGRPGRYAPPQRRKPPRFSIRRKA